MKLKTPEPFWLLKNGIVHSYPSLKENISTEILIVGGGITGSLIAHQCIKEGYKTVVVDRREIGNGSTSATTSMLQYEIDIPLYKLVDKIGKKPAVESYKACSQSIDDLQNICKEINSKAGFRKKQSLYFAAYKKDVNWLKAEFEARKDAGFKVKWLEASEILQKLQLSNTFGGILSEQGGSVDAFLLAHELLDYNAKKGLQIFDKTELADFNYSKKGVLAKTQDGHEIKANRVIFCNGFESTEIIKENFVKLLSTYAIVGERDECKKLPLDDTVVWNTAEPYLYMRTTDDNRILAGGEDVEYIGDKKRTSMLHSKSKNLVKKVKKYLPDCDFRMDFAWAGTFGETKDGLPYIGEHKDFPGAYFVLGFGGNGITFSVIGMDMVASHLKGKKHPLAEHFKFGR